ncbi:HAMP domain-containing histidine kinase [Candidatus Parcubacteria bacterium]|nr:HAMP domain-containing histidine kinase [Candidatus Parcubacteria bacterium]
MQRQALLLGQLFNASVFEDISDVDYLQEKLDSVAQANTDLRTFDILVPQGDDFKVVASLEPGFIDRTTGDLNYVIAWHREEAVATLVSDIGRESGGDSERFWEIAMPLTNVQGEKEALLSIRMSLAVMDDLAKDTLTKSYIILSITVLIVILLLALNTRLFEHAILFRRLKEVDKMKDEFISIASHELRTPITTIKGFLSMSLEGDYGELSEGSKKGFKIMEASVNRLGHLVEDLLNVSRIEQNRLIVKKEPVDLKAVLDSLMLEFELRVKAKNLALKLSADKDLPQVWADEDKLKQVIINLLGNSIKYTKQGEIELIAKKTDEKLITITIKDSGIGMDASEREKLFEKFYRVQGEETRGIIGTGLGLWITKQLVELMGGTISVDSIKHVGSQFYFTIPIYNKETHKIEEKPQTEKRNQKTA